jgi:hypothetical protein
MWSVPGLPYQQKETMVSQDNAGEFAASAELVFNIDIPGRTPADIEQRFADLIAEAFKKLFEEAEEAAKEVQKRFSLETKPMLISGVSSVFLSISNSSSNSRNR